MRRFKLPRVLKFTLAGREFHTLTTLSAKKPVASTVVTMRFKQFVGMSSGLANMTKFKCFLQKLCIRTSVRQPVNTRQTIRDTWSNQ